MQAKHNHNSINHNGQSKPEAFTQAFVPKEEIDLNKIEEFLKGRIEYFGAELTRLEAELKHNKILLQGHQTWLLEAERTIGGER